MNTIIKFPGSILKSINYSDGSAHRHKTMIVAHSLAIEFYARPSAINGDIVMVTIPKDDPVTAEYTVILLKSIF